MSVLLFRYSFFYFLSLCFLDQFGKKMCNLMLKKKQRYTFCFDNVTFKMNRIDKYEEIEKIRIFDSPKHG